MISVSKGVLKSRMLEYFRKVEETGEPLVVTSHRKPVLRIESIRSRGTLGEVFKGVSTGLTVSREALLAPETEGWEALK